jgi:hypothetical protein
MKVNEDTDFDSQGSHYFGFRLKLRGTKTMSHIYSVWLGRSVILQIDAGESWAPLRGEVVGESSHAVRFRLAGRWEVDVPKELVLGVQPDN